MNKHDWLLLLLALKDSNEELDEVRLQAGMFMLGEIPGFPPEERYAAEPFDLPAFNLAITNDLDKLERENLIMRDDRASIAWSEFVITRTGQEQAVAILEELDDGRLQALERLGEIKHTYLSASFRELADHLHAKYPAFAARQVFR